MNEKLTEKQIEQYLVRRVKEIGGTAYKFVSPGHDGAPDRLVCLPDGVVYFVELKAPGKKPTALQLAQHARLRELDQFVAVCDCIADIDALPGLGGDVK